MLAFLQSGLDRAFDNKAVTGVDLASQRDPLSDNQRSAINFVRPSAGSPPGRCLRHSYRAGFGRSAEIIRLVCHVTILSPGNCVQ